MRALPCRLAAHEPPRPSPSLPLAAAARTVSEGARADTSSAVCATIPSSPNSKRRNRTQRFPEAGSRIASRASLFSATSSLQRPRARACPSFAMKGASIARLTFRGNVAPLASTSLCSATSSVCLFARSLPLRIIDSNEFIPCTFLIDALTAVPTSVVPYIIPDFLSVLDYTNARFSFSRFFLIAANSAALLRSLARHGQRRRN